MEFPERISAKVTSVIAEQLTEFSEDKLAEINYGIAVFITNSYKTLIMFMLAYIMGIFAYFLVALTCFGLLRSFASGVHAKREWTCLPVSLLLFFGIVYAGMAITLDFYSISTVFILCLAVMFKYSPADTEEKIIVSRKLRKKLKILSCITLMLLYAASLYYIGTTVSSIIVFSSLAESAMIMPITYKLSGSIYGVGIEINKKKEVRK